MRTQQVRQPAASPHRYRHRKTLTSGSTTKSAVFLFFFPALTIQLDDSIRSARRSLSGS